MAHNTVAYKTVLAWHKRLVVLTEDNVERSLLEVQLIIIEETGMEETFSLQPSWL